MLLLQCQAGKHPLSPIEKQQGKAKKDRLNVARIPNRFLILLSPFSRQVLKMTMFWVGSRLVAFGLKVLVPSLGGVLSSLAGYRDTGP